MLSAEDAAGHGEGGEEESARYLDLFVIDGIAVGHVARNGIVPEVAEEVGTLGFGGVEVEVAEFVNDTYFVDEL